MLPFISKTLKRKKKQKKNGRSLQVRPKQYSTKHSTSLKHLWESLYVRATKLPKHLPYLNHSLHHCKQPTVKCYFCNYLIENMLNVIPNNILLTTHNISLKPSWKSLYVRATKLHKHLPSLNHPLHNEQPKLSNDLIQTC